MTTVYSLNESQDTYLKSASMLDTANVLERMAENLFVNGGIRSCGITVLANEAAVQLMREGSIDHTYRVSAAPILMLDCYTPTYLFYTTLACVNAMLLAAAEARHIHKSRDPDK